MKKENIISLSMILLLLALSCWYYEFKMVKFRSMEFEKIIEILSVFFLLALFMERALEVFVATWRGGEASEMDLSIKKFKRTIAKLKVLEDKENAVMMKESEKSEKEEPETEEKTISGTKHSLSKIKDDLDKAHDDLEAARLKKTIYKAHTQRLALWAGLVIGILASAVGFRALESMVDPADICSFSRFQCISFRIVDVFLTGCLIAGGSEGIHQFMQVYSNFMEQTATRAKRDPHSSGTIEHP